LIPVFFVSTGVGLDITALFHSTRAIILVPVFLVALLLVRGLPALLYVRVVGRTRAIAAGFMQATSLTFIVVATVIGVQTGHQRTSTAAARVVAGLLSVVIYPPVALRTLKSAASRPVSPAPTPEPDPS
jgi:Kef-type K+ transport system membrane component KefB